MLSTNPKAIPEQMQAILTYLHATIIRKPFDIDVVLAAVRDAAVRITAR